MVVIDLEQLIIPNVIQVLFAILAFIYIIHNNIDMSERLVSSIIYFSIIQIIGWIISKIKKDEAIGGGDIKFITIVGLFLGLENLANFLFISGLIGAVFAFIWRVLDGKKKFPFGPALAISLILCLYFFN